MPTFVIYTNLPKSGIPDTFLKEASIFAATQLKKPESYVTVRVHPDQLMSHGGTPDICGSVEVYSIGSFGGDNKDHARAFTGFIEEHLHIPKDRFYVNFHELKRSDVSLAGNTFG
ncbi:hypothetical protein ScPMuIL_006731 [Solemya velum]